VLCHMLGWTVWADRQADEMARCQMKEDNTPTVTSRRRTPSAKVRLRLETAKRIRALNNKHTSARARKQAAKQSAGDTDPDARVSTTSIPRIKKNKVADPPKATSKFKKRQIHKTWLPTHLWHAKRAHLTRPSEPLWRIAIPLSPTEKSYRPTHYSAGGRGAVAWDMSYMSTIGCQGVEASLIAMLKAVGLCDENVWGSKGRKWMQGTRSANGWAYERDNERRPIAPIIVLWAAERERSSIERSKDVAVDAIDTEDHDAAMEHMTASSRTKTSKPRKRKLLLRVHPAAFHQLWTELFKVAKMQRPSVVLEDLRFEIASMDVLGPGSTEALCAVLKPVTSLEVPLSSSALTWAKLAGLTNPASLPHGAIMTFNVSDPRLAHPRRPLAIKTDDSGNDKLTDLIVDWPPDNASLPPDIFSYKARRAASRSLLSQKAISRRKGACTPGEAPQPKETDPQIPLMLLASRSNANASAAQGRWTVFLPWKCLDPIWRCLMYYPLNSGGTARFGGLDETRQIAFERNEAWFPGDFPGTEAGKAWESTESEKRYEHWSRKPPSRRVNYDSLRLGVEYKGEHGRGWACDWNFLHGRGVDSPNASSNEEPQQSRDTCNTGNGPATDISTGESKVSSQATDEKQISSGAAVAAATTFTQLSPNKASTMLNPFSTSSASPSNGRSLATIRITLLARGTPSPCARIYRLPSLSGPPSTGTTPSLRSKWLALDPHLTQTSLLPTKKVKTNWRNDAAVPTAYPDEHTDIDAINYRPPNMVPEAVAEVEKTRGELRGKRERFQKQKLQMKLKEKSTAGGVDVDVDVEAMTAGQREDLMSELMRPNADKDRDAATPTCPGVGDLIGFVTSGGYNLAVGRGTAVGAVWVQRVLAGWAEEIRAVEMGLVQVGEQSRAGRVKGMRATERQRERERRLCVVRNAGESVARLGIWEVCE
jgi:ribonuclease P/MRP protein subunit POP1